MERGRREERERAQHEPLEVRDPALAHDRLEVVVRHGQAVYKRLEDGPDPLVRDGVCDCVAVVVEEGEAREGLEGVVRERRW